MILHLFHERNTSGEAAFWLGAQRRRARRWLWAAASLALAAALGLAGWWAWRHFRPAPPFKAGDRYIVADFVNETSDIELGLALREYMEMFSRYVTLAAVSRWEDMNVAALDGAAAEARCLKGECEGYITGRIAGDPDGYRLEIALHRVDRAEPVVALSAQTDANRIGDAVHEMLWDLAQRVMQQAPGLGAPPDEVESMGCVVWSGGANSLKAFHALPKIDRDIPAMLAAGRRAVELDPAYMAANWLVGDRLFFGLGRRREAIPYFKKGVDLGRAAAEKNPQCRLATLGDEIMYLNLTWDYDALAERVNAAVQLAPGAVLFLMYYAQITESMMDDPVAALPYYRKIYDVAPDWGRGMLRDALLRAGRTDEVDALVEDYRRQPGAHPDRDGWIAHHEILAAMGRADDYAAILEMYERGVKEGRLTESGIRPELLTWMGRLAEAEEWNVRLLPNMTTRDARSGASTGRRYSRLDWLAKRRTGKVRLLSAADQENHLKDDRFFTLLARMSVFLDTAVSLKEVLGTLEEEQKDNRSRRVLEAMRLARGCVAVVERRAAEAVALLEPLARDHGPASSLGPQTVLARAYEAAGRWADAARTLEAVFAERRFWAWRDEPCAIYVLEQHRLAGIYDRLGNTERARYWYGRFLHDWRNADPGMPEVEDAKRRLAALGGPLP